MAEIGLEPAATGGSGAVASVREPTGTGASPGDLFEGYLWLVHTKPRNEKALATNLTALGIGFFLPLAKARRRYAGRTVLVELPLFPGYLFVCGGAEERYATLMTHRAVNVLAVADQERLKRELREVHRATSSGEPVDLYPGIRRGRRCRVTHGCLRGLEGVVIRRRDICRVYLGVQALGQSAELEIDASQLEIIE